MKIVTIVGARPQFIKSVTVSRCLKNYSEINEIMVHTGQHFDKEMSTVFFEELQIPKPTHFLDINGCSHGEMVGRMLSSMEALLMKEKPNMVLVYGDTNSTLAGALAASKLHIPVSHIESGLRSFNRKMPEEINRVLTDHVSDFLFCSTTASVKNLHNEGIRKGVHQVGDVMYDSALLAGDVITRHRGHFAKKLHFVSEDYALLTIHREESTENTSTFLELIDYAANFAKQKKIKIVFPVHPRIKSLIKSIKANSTFYFTPPLSYFETQYLIKHAHSVLTDSGGLQKEAYFHRTPCITLRNETEWVETIEAGWNRLWKNETYNKKREIAEYGSGQAAKKIVEILRA